MKNSLLFDCLKISNTHKNRHIDQFKHFSYVIQNNKIIAWGKNKGTWYSRVRGYPSTCKIHSEINALKRAHLNGKHGEGFIMINIRVNRFGAFRNSKPCNCCQFYLKLFGCTEVWYTTYFGFERMIL